MIHAVKDYLLIGEIIEIMAGLPYRPLGRKLANLASLVKFRCEQWSVDFLRHRKMNKVNN